MASKIKIMTLNIHNYHDFEERKTRIIKLIKRYNPDIVALQEIRKNKKFHQEDQAKQLNQELKFKYHKFLQVNNINKAKGLINVPPCYEGLAILSKFPFSNEEILLKKHKEDKFVRKILVANIQIENQIIPIWVVHFSNNDLFASLHAKEALNHIKKPQPIILGDFNIKYPSEIKKLAEENNYSTNLNYVSFPEDNCNYDYIFIPKKFTFLTFECLPEIVSDHKALFAEIKL